MIFIKRTNVKKSVCIFAALINLILFFTKLYIAVSTNSISIYVDSLNCLADTFVCGLAFTGFILSASKPNDDFPFGYGKAEELINLLLSTVILVTGFAFAYSSLQRLFYPVPVWYSIKYAATILITAFVKLLMAFVFRRAERNEKSEIIRNLKIDSYLDFLMSLCIVISFTLTSRIGYAVDSVMGLIASVIVIINGIRSVRSSCFVIIGKRNNTACDEVANAVNCIDGVKTVDDIQCHSYGNHMVFTVVITVNCSSAEDVARLCELLKNTIKNKFGYDLYVTVGGVL